MAGEGGDVIIIIIGRCGRAAYTTVTAGEEGKTNEDKLCQCKWHVSCALENKTNQHCPTAVHMKPFGTVQSLGKRSAPQMIKQGKMQRRERNMYRQATVKLTFSLVMVIWLDLPVGHLASAGTFVVPLVSKSLSWMQS